MVCFSIKNKAGFTLVELLIVISIIVLLGLVAVLGFQNLARFQQFQQVASGVEFNLKEAASNARAAVGGSAHGVWFSGSTLVRFAGNSYVAGDPNNIIIDYPIAVFTLDLSDSGQEIVFAELSGLPSATGTVLIEGLRFAGTSTITISDTGIVE
jgi:prepilin-type N-terminal cleavage/methylation domain-containing protein